jgi:hypothetical protein
MTLRERNGALHKKKAIIARRKRGIGIEFGIIIWDGIDKMSGTALLGFWRKPWLRIRCTSGIRFARTHRDVMIRGFVCVTNKRRKNVGIVGRLSRIQTSNESIADASRMRH